MITACCSPGGAASWFMLIGLPELYSGGMWNTDNPLLRCDEDERAHLC